MSSGDNWSACTLLITNLHKSFKIVQFLFHEIYMYVFNIKRINYAAVFRDSRRSTDNGHIGVKPKINYVLSIKKLNAVNLQ